MQQRKEITIQSREDQDQCALKNEQNNQNDLKVYQKNEIAQDNNNGNPQFKPFKDISSSSPNKHSGGYIGNSSKISKPKNQNFLVLKNRSSIKQIFINQEIKQTSKQKQQFQLDAQNENQENEHQQQQNGKESNRQEGNSQGIKKKSIQNQSNDQSHFNAQINQNSNSEGLTNQEKNNKEKSSDKNDSQQDSVSDSTTKGLKNKESQKKKIIIYSKGYECEDEIENDMSFINKILSEGQYRPSKEWKDLFDNGDLLDKRAVGSLLGVTVFGIVGFVASGLNPIGLVAGAITGGVIGQYAGRKIKKKLQRNKKMFYFDLFTFKLNCYIVFGQEKMKSLKYDINNYRFYFDKVIKEMKVVVQYRSFKQKYHKEIKKILNKFLKLLAKDQCYKAIYLSYKLTKEIIKRKETQANTKKNQIEVNGNQKQDSLNSFPAFTIQEEEQIIDVVLNVLNPILNILNESPDQLTPTLKQFQFKLEKLLKKITILNLIHKGNQVFIDKNGTIQYIEELDKQLDKEMDKQAFKIIFNPEHQKYIEDLSKEDNQNSEQVQGVNQFLTQNANNINDGDTKNRQKKSNDQENGSAVNDSQKIQIQEMSSQKKEEDYILKEQDQRLREEDHNLRDNENDHEDKSNIPNVQKKGFQNTPSQYPSFSKQHLSKISYKDSLNLNETSNINDSSQNQINLENINSHVSNSQSQQNQNDLRSFKQNEGRLFLKMLSVGDFSAKREKSPKCEKQKQLMGDYDSPMRDSIPPSQIHDLNSQSKQLIDTPKRKSYLNNIIDLKLDNIQLNSIQKIHSQYRQSIISRDDNHQEEIVVVHIPEIQKEDKMSLSISKDDPDKLDAPTQEKFDRLISLVKEDPEKTWECVIKKDDSMFIYKKMIPGNPCVLVRAESLVKDCNSEEVFVQIYQAEIRSQWDKVTQGFTVIETIQEGVDVIYFFVDPGLGVTKRDFCQRRVLKKDYPEKGQITIVFFSITHPNCPERKGYIRAHSHIAGYVIRPVGKDTSLTIMTQSDVKGSVPKYVVNFMAARAPPKWIESMKKGCLDYRNSKGGTQKKKK